MKDVDRFHAGMNYQPRDRAPLREFPWPTWPETADRWRAKGGYDPERTDFGCDRWLIDYQWFFPHPPFDRLVIDEDDTYVTFVDPQGIVMREFKRNPLSSMPQFVSFPVKTRHDFRKF